jgi:hypothetical protein
VMMRSTASTVLHSVIPSGIGTAPLSSFWLADMRDSFLEWRTRPLNLSRPLGAAGTFRRTALLVPRRDVASHTVTKAVRSRVSIRLRTGLTATAHSRATTSIWFPVVIVLLTGIWRRGGAGDRPPFTHQSLGLFGSLAPSPIEATCESSHRYPSSPSGIATRDSPGHRSHGFGFS